jgi:N-methylhydantoinase B
LSNGKITPLEIIESEFPTRVERFELTPDSGGPGEYRGGLGFVREYTILQDARFSLRTDKHRIAPSGIAGGKEGSKGICIVNPGSEEEKDLPSRFGDYTLQNGDSLRLVRPGGGGIGDPYERSPERVLEDVRQGYVSMERAMLDYGVALLSVNGNLTVDQSKTYRLRTKKKAGKTVSPLL